MPSRRTATGAGRRTRAVSCMRSLDQTRQLRPEMLRWCKGRPSARRPQCPAANPCDWSDSDLFALEGDPHQRCLAMTVHPAERKGWVIDDQRTTTGANHESPLASGGATPRRPLPPTSARKCHATCEQRRLRHNGRRRQQQTRTPHHDQRRAASGLREPNSNSVTRLSRTQRDLRLCLTACASADARRGPNVHRPAARCEAALPAHSEGPAAGTQRAQCEGRGRSAACAR
jgi:hypothetical protein